MNRLSVILLTLAAFSAAGGQLLFKIGARGRENFFEFINITILVGILIYGIATIIWIYVLSYEKLVNVYAFTALTFVLVYLCGIFILNEKVSIAGIVGIFLVIGGLYLIASNYNT